MSNLGFTMVVPIVALVFATAAFGDLKEDSTLVYLWLRPMDRWPMGCGRMACRGDGKPAGDPCSLDCERSHHRCGFADLVWATVLACVVGTLAYCSGVLAAWPVVEELGCVGDRLHPHLGRTCSGQSSSVGEKLAIRGYTRSIIAEQTGVESLARRSFDGRRHSCASTHSDCRDCAVHPCACAHST